MNPRKATLLILVTTSASLALADDFKTIAGKEYKDATVTQVEVDGITVKTKSGISKIYFQERGLFELPAHLDSSFPVSSIPCRLRGASEATHCFRGLFL
jgi:hypothetical protein